MIENIRCQNCIAQLNLSRLAVTLLFLPFISLIILANTVQANVEILGFNSQGAFDLLKEATGETFYSAYNFYIPTLQVPRDPGFTLISSELKFEFPIAFEFDPPPFDIWITQTEKITVDPPKILDVKAKISTGLFEMEIWPTDMRSERINTPFYSTSYYNLGSYFGVRFLSWSFDIKPIPAPSALLLVVSGLAAVIGLRRKRIL